MTCSKSIEHSTFTWTIHNFSLCLAEASYTFRSPVFELHRSRTRWFLELSTDYCAGPNVILTTLLCRDSAEDNAEDVYVRFVLSVESVGKTCSWKSAECVNLFNKVTRCGDDYATNLSRSTVLFKDNISDDVMLVSCDMVLIYDCPTLMADIDPDFDALSRDLLHLFHSKELGNSVLVAGESEIVVHKEVLSTRSQIFADLFASGETRIIAPFSKETMLMLLIYVYSDKIQNLAVSVPPPLELHKCAKHYGISCLESILEPQNMFAKSLILTADVNCTLDISNFASCGLSNQTYCAQIGREIIFQCFVEHDSRHGNLIVFIHLSNLADVVCLSMEMNILDTGKNKLITRTALLHPEEDKTSCKTIFIPEELIYGRENSLHLNNVFIDFVLRFRFNNSWEVRIPTSYTATPGVPNPGFFSQFALQQTMKQLLTSSMHADARIEVAGKVVNVHKSVLTARSPIFKDIFGQTETVSSELPVEVFNQMLFYIYTGYLSCRHPLSLIELHSVAEEYEIPQLKGTCIRLVSESPLTIYNVSNICLFAKSLELHDLKQKCIDFISQNLDLVLDKPGWTFLKEEDVDLSLEILYAAGIYN